MAQTGLSWPKKELSVAQHCKQPLRTPPNAVHHHNITTLRGRQRLVPLLRIRDQGVWELRKEPRRLPFRVFL